MKQAAVKAHAKINLTLDIIGKRPNGYHDVCMVMQSIGVHDVVTVTTGTGENSIALQIPDSNLPLDSRNLAYRAAELFLQESGIACDGILIEIEKNIPVASGLAGGSTNAAAVITLLNQLYDTHFSIEKCMEIGLKLGADVPFCIAGGTMRAEGIGEKLTRLPDVPQAYVILCTPPVTVSTPAIYRAVDTAEIYQHPNTSAMQQAIAEKNLVAIADNLCNVMQPVTAAMHPEINEICKVMKQYGALNAVMSGSGPSVFGLFDNAEQAQAVCDILKKQYIQTFLTGFSDMAQIIL